MHFPVMLDPFTGEAMEHMTVAAGEGNVPKGDALNKVPGPIGFKLPLHPNEFG